MKIFVNDIEIDFESEKLTDLLKKYEQTANFAIAVNGKIIKKTDFINCQLNANDKIDILTIAEGG